MIRANSLPNDETNCIPNPNAAKNPFLTKEMETGVLPTCEDSRPLLPKPWWQGHEDVIDFMEGNPARERSCL